MNTNNLPSEIDEILATNLPLVKSMSAGKMVWFLDQSHEDSSLNGSTYYTCLENVQEQIEQCKAQIESLIESKCREAVDNSPQYLATKIRASEAEDELKQTEALHRRYAELTSAHYSIVVENKQLTYVIEKDGNTLSINANPLYEFLKEMFTTDWKNEAGESPTPTNQDKD